MLTIGLGGIIDIFFPSLDTSIGRLKTMLGNWKSMDSKPPKTVGGGASVNEMELIGNTYDKMHTHMCDMLSETILFMEKTRKSYIEADEKARDRIIKIIAVIGRSIGSNTKPKWPPIITLPDGSHPPYLIKPKSPLKPEPGFFIKPKPGFFNVEPDFIFNVGKGAVQMITETIPKWVAGVLGG